MNDDLIFIGLIILVFAFCVWNVLLKNFLNNIVGIIRAKRYVKKYKTYNFYQIDSMDGLEFESFLCACFSKQGYKSYTTPPSNDFGADLVLEKNHERTVVQAKRYKQKVGISAVQEVVASKAYYKASKAMVVTNSFYTQAAKDLAKVNCVELLDRNDLFKLVDILKQ